METSQAPGLEQAIVEFCRFARANGITAGVKESLEAVRAASVVGVEDRQSLKFALRAVLCSTKADWDIFDEIFDVFWSESAGQVSLERTKRSKNVREQESQQENAELASMAQSSAAMA